MKIVAKIAVLGLMLTGLSFAKHPRQDRTYYRDYNRNYGYSQRYDGYSPYRDYGYRNYEYGNSYRVPPGLQNRRYRDLPPGIQKKLRREAIRERYDTRYWRGW